MSKELGDLLCRACLQEDELMVDIYENVEELQMNLCTLLELCGDIKVEELDAYPKYLCQECTNELLVAAKFRRKCFETQQTLSELANKEESTLTERDEDSVVDEENDEIIEVDGEEQLAQEISASNEVECGTETIALAEVQDIEVGSSKHSNPMSYNCDDCGALFHQPATLQRHIEKTHTPNIIYSCDQCGHSFTQQCNLQAHSCDKTEQSSVPRTDRHRCVHCDKCFASPASLVMHMRLHTGERPFVCDVCPKSFKTNAALVTHQKRHLQLAQYSCPHCGKCFVESSNLKRHIVSLHTGERPHSCTICQRSFSRVYLLELHMRTHTGERPYACSMCDRRFAQQGVLRTHERTHTGQRMHSCSVCGRSFSRAIQLRRHRCKGETHTDRTQEEDERQLELETAEQLEHGSEQGNLPPGHFECFVISEEVVSADDDPTTWCLATSK
ncbi:zinc finger protein 771 [Scaptodrosophila lebanonensis]|uniref:Protein krueppel n=1 Tax=Drosophila lebanonensis TaxID=7225 RepID=A0A6J2THQ0_DROLE|nr:zinc finger protein 771 [Scaptodrosophila lebanonensis]